MRSLLVPFLAVLVLTLPGCNCGDPSGGDAGTGGGAAAGGLGGGGGGSAGGGAGATGGGSGGGGSGASDAGTFSCAGFSAPSGWTTAPGFRAVVAATASSGISLPVALTFAGGPFGGALYVVNQGTQQVSRVDPATGTGAVFSVLDGGPAPALLTTITWDAQGSFDGQLYVGDQGSDGDADSRLYRLTTQGELSAWVSAGPGFDDIYGMAFTPALPGWPRGLLVAGDTDRATPDQWGLVAADGSVSTFSPLVGVEGLAVDPSGRYGAEVLASRPAGGGYAGDDSVTRVLPDGGSGGAVASGLPGIHAVAVAPPGPFGGKAYAASWQTQTIVALELDGGVSPVASGLALTNYDGNILAFSPDGRVLMVADRTASRVVCIDVP